MARGNPEASDKYRRQVGALQAQISRVKKRNKEMRDLLERAYPFVAGFRDGPEYDDEAIVLGDSIIDALQAER